MMAMLGTEARKEKFVSGLKANRTLSRAAMMGIGHLLLFLAGFAIMGYVKLWTYNSHELNEQSQITISSKYGWLQLVGALVAIVVVLKQVKAVATSAAEVSSMKQSARTGMQWKELMKDINERADATSFQTGNVFYEVLFSPISNNLPWASYLYFGFSIP